MDKGVRLIATGLALTYKKRKAKIDLINAHIDSIRDAIRSSSDVDGMPHSGTVTDPVSAKAVKIEALEAIRDEEQARVNAVEWAEQAIRDRSDDDEADALLELLWTYLQSNREVVDKYIDEHAFASLYVAKSLKTRFLNDIASYLHLNDY